MIRLNATYLFPQVLKSTVEARVSSSRIQTFLELPEHEVSSADHARKTTASQHNAEQGPVLSTTAFHGTLPNQPFVKFSDVTCEWTAGHPVLTKVSFDIRASELLCIAGPVGCGKSTLLMSILREIEPTSGSVHSFGSFAYASQEAWILSSSLRENILFGLAFDEDWYEQVVVACSLQEDIKEMPDGDATEIGERGVTLSGGQKARLSLARAVYSKRAVYLLDDPLSAVDTIVGRHIFEQCICGLLKDKVRILVTHQVQYLPFVDKILLLKEHGVPEGFGSYSDLLAANVLKAPTKPDAVEEKKVEEEQPRVKKFSRRTRESSKLFLEETRKTGTVSMQTYSNYWRSAGGWSVLIIMFVLLVLTQGLSIVFDLSLALWVQQSVSERDSLGPLLFLGLSCGVYVIFTFIRPYLFFARLIRSSQTLHDNMFEAVLSTGIHFFDTNPVGRILNRFSKDLGFLDDLLPWCYFDFLTGALGFVGIVLFISIANPWIFLATVPLSALFLYLRSFYMKFGRDSKRIEATERSPVFSHFSTSLAGLAIIRCHESHERFVERLFTLLDTHGAAFHMFMSATRWLGIRIDTIASAALTVLVFVAIAVRDSLPTGLVALSIVYSLQLLLGIQWMVRQSAEVESQMTSVERLLEYAKLPAEQTQAAKDECIEPSPTWPESGAFSFEDVYMQYSPSLPYTLRSVSFQIRAKEKIGVVGRTGAGKSSLLTALFRLCGHIRGSIRIDGVDTSTLRLQKLRSMMSAIPQDPTLFSGSIRYNLDPFDQFSDDLIWKALDDVQLKPAVQRVPGGIQASVSEAGGNFSVGQRQLFCLARAILRKNRILVLDEATANVDNATDSLIQRTIRTHFKDCTVFTIAHRLHTVIDCDRILVMDAGSVMEFDAPFRLLQNRESYFYGLVDELPEQEQARLRRMALDAYVLSKLEHMDV
eukprot:m.592762 g.592762  ORF g.592762 m.592762 type:complete len:933 (-) comp58023_c0_seq1:1350-4148(-)